MLKSYYLHCETSQHELLSKRVHSRTCSGCDGHLLKDSDHPLLYAPPLARSSETAKLLRIRDTLQLKCRLLELRDFEELFLYLTGYKLELESSKWDLQLQGCCRVRKQPMEIAHAGLIFFGISNCIEVQPVIDDEKWLPGGIPCNMLIVGLILQQFYMLLNCSDCFRQPPFP